MLRLFWRQAYLAITDFDFYASVFQQPFRQTSLFLLYLCAFLTLALTLIYASFYGPRVERFFDWADENFPPIEVTDGELQVMADQPVVTKYKDDSTWTFVFDTTGTYSDPSGLEEPVLLFTQEKLYVQMQGQTQTYLWEDFGEFSVTPENLGEYETIVVWAYFPFAYSFLLIYHILAKALQALILSPIAYSVAISYGVRLPLANSFTIALYSLVPAIVIDLAIAMTGIDISYFDLIYLAIAGLYAFMASQRCATAH
jgi:hypothetical protein